MTNKALLTICKKLAKMAKDCAELAEMDSMWISTGYLLEVEKNKKSPSFFRL